MPPVLITCSASLPAAMCNSSSTREHEASHHSVLHSSALHLVHVLSHCVPSNTRSNQALPCQFGSGFWSLLLVAGNAPNWFHACSHSSAFCLVACNVQISRAAYCCCDPATNSDAAYHLLVAGHGRLRYDHTPPHSPMACIGCSCRPEQLRYWDVPAGCECQSGRAGQLSAGEMATRPYGSHGSQRRDGRTTTNEGNQLTLCQLGCPHG